MPNFSSLVGLEVALKKHLNFPRFYFSGGAAAYLGGAAAYLGGAAAYLGGAAAYLV